MRIQKDNEDTRFNAFQIAIMLLMVVYNYLVDTQVYFNYIPQCFGRGFGVVLLSVELDRDTAILDITICNWHLMFDYSQIGCYDQEIQ